jgi:hypothetical protein
MLIAQPTVACEDAGRSSVSTPTELDQDAMQEFASDQTNLPWIIFRAAHRANHAAALPARSRALLAALARTVDANRPYAAIFARRELLTGRAMQSMRTFYRSLDDLEAAGLITRPPQKRHGNVGMFGRAYLHLTEKATVALGLVEVPANPTTSPAAQSRGTSAASPSTFSTASATVADGAIYKDLFPKNQKRQSGALPMDLQRLRGLGFHEFLIFKLMREARLQNKRLSDVVEATWEHLRQALHPINYLRTLIRSTVDFSHQVRAAHSARQHAEAQKAHAAQLIEAISSLAGQSFYDAENNRRFDISRSADEVLIHDCREAQPRVARTNWRAEFIAAMQGGHIVAASAERQAAHGEKCRARHGHHAASPAVHLTDSKPLRTPAIDQRLSDMKQFLRSVCAGRGVRDVLQPQ